MCRRLFQVLMRSRTSLQKLPWILLLILLLSGCDLGQGEGTMEALEQNYRQVRQVNRDSEVITDDFIRNLRDSLDVKLADTLRRTEEDLLEFQVYRTSLDSIRQNTHLVIDLIDEHLKVMESMAIKNPETGRFEAKGEDDISHKYWQTRSRVEGMRQGLIRYEGSLIQFSRDRNIRVDEIYDNSFWLQFSNARPVIAYLALLEGLKASVYAYERRALQLLFGQFGTPYFRSDNLIILNQPEAQIVTAGMPFKSQLRVGLTTSRVKSRFEGTGVTPNQDSVSASIEIGANGELIPSGKNTATQNYEATIKVPRADGGFVNLNLNESFTIVRPVVKIQSAGSQALYRKCENILRIDVPGLAHTFTPEILVTQATINPVEGAEKTFSIIPDADSCLITINTKLGDSSILIDQINYRVIEPPKPSIELWVNEQLHNGFSLIPRTSRLLLKIIPDPEFLAAHPNDARYGFTTVDVMIQRDMGAPDVVKTVSGLTREAIKGIPIDLGQQVEQAFPGTTIYLRINEIFRKNFVGQDLPEKRFTESERIIGLVVR